MTSIGQRPTLAELIVILSAITKVEADVDALNPESKEFRVVLTFTRELMDGVPNWAQGQPTPSHAFDEIYSHLVRWQAQKAREAQWVSKDGELGSIDGLLAHYYAEFSKAADARPETITTRVQKRVLSITMLRLQELKERREAGGVYSAPENRREKARKAWAEEEFEAPNREKAQAEARERMNANAEGIFREYNRHFRDTMEGMFHDSFARGFYGTDWAGVNTPPTKKYTGERPWHEVLGVSPSATKAEIQKAYRALVKTHQPRTAADSADPAKAARMAEINVARDRGMGGL